MALESVLANLDGLDDSLKAHYSEVADVGFVLQTNNFVTDNVSYGNVDTKNLKSALDSERTARKEAERGVQGLEAYTSLGTAEEITAKLNTASDVGTKVDERIESLRTEYEGKLTTAAATATEALDGMKKANHSREVTALLNSVAGDVVEGEGPQNYLTGILKSMTALDALGNVIVVNPDGSPRQTLAVDSVANMSLEEAWGMIKGDPTHGFAIKASGASGSGSTGSSGGSANISGTPTNAADWNGMSSVAQTAFYNANPARATELAIAGAKVQ
jgi:hypothetical protein